MTRKIVLILAVGLLLRLILAFSTFHSDVAPFYFAGEVITKGNILNFYDYLANLPAGSEILKIYPTYLFNYPPLVYFFLGPINYFLALPFGKDLLHKFIFDLPSLLGNLELNFLLLTQKLVYLPFDVGAGVLVYKLFSEQKKKLLALILWIFNPLVLYSAYVMGQFDIIPTFFVIAALYLAVKKGKVFLPSLLLGLGMSFKIYPLLFLVPLAFLKEKWLDRFKVVLVGIAPYVLSMLPFLSSRGFKATALVAGQTTKSLYAAIPISGGESIILFLAFLLFLYIVFLFSKNDIYGLWKKFFVLMLLFFIFTHYHPQWFVWITPFFVIDLVESRLKSLPLILFALASWLGLVFFFDPGLSVWLFSPLFPNLYGLPDLWHILGLNIDINMGRSVLQTIFVSVGIYYIYRDFPRKIEG